MKNSEQTQSSASVTRLVRRTKKLLSDIEDEGYLLSMVSGGGQPQAILHPEDTDLEADSYFESKSGIHNLGSVGVGDIIAL